MTRTAAGRIPKVHADVDRTATALAVTGSGEGLRRATQRMASTAKAGSAIGPSWMRRPSASTWIDGDRARSGSDRAMAHPQQVGVQGAAHQLHGAAHP